MCPRYFSSALFPEAVNEYSVFGIRPSNDFLQARYPASSSLRAWTLTLPSVVFRIAFISLNVSDGFTASALTIERRVFSWMSRSKSGIDVSTGCRRGATASAILRAALATVPPRDHDSECDVQPAEACAEEHVPHAHRDEAGQHAHDHETDPHHRHDRDRERTTADERSAVEQEPRRRQHRVQPRVSEEVRQCGAGGDRREVAAEKTSRRGPVERDVRAPRLTEHRDRRDRRRDDRAPEPSQQPSPRPRERVRQHRGRDGGEPHSHATPPGDRRERRGALHRLPDIAEVAESVLVNRGRIHGDHGTAKRFMPKPALIPYNNASVSAPEDLGCATSQSLSVCFF